MTDPLVTRRDAATALGVQEGEVDDAVKSGQLTEVYARSSPEGALETFVLGSDIDTLLSGSNSAMNRAIREKAFRGRRQPDETLDAYLRRRGAR